MMERPASRLIVALDYPSAEAALALVHRLRDIPIGMFKVGSELFTAAGPPLVREILGQGQQVFLDLKFHDIPNTVAGATAAAAGLGVAVLTVHAAGGREMMRAAAEAARAASSQTRVVAVTVLTSLARQDLKRSGVSRSPQQQVLALAKTAREAGLHGVVASPQEVEALRRRFPKPFLLVTPGIRPTWAAAAGDQKRIATPSAALAAGADYLVVGRPITAASDPAQAAARIVDELVTASRKF